MTDVLLIQDFDDETFDPFDDSSTWGDATDAHMIQQRILERGGPVQRGTFREASGLARDVNAPEERPHFMLFGADRIRKVLNDPTGSKAHFKKGFGDVMGNSLTCMDPPDHPKYRRVFQSVFFPGKIVEWSKHLIEPVLDELVQEMKPLGRCELTRAFTFPYPFEIIYRQLQLPPGDTRVFHGLAVAQNHFVSDLLPKAIEAGQKLGAYFQAILTERRANPGDDLISLLARAEVQGETLPDDVIVSFLRQLINAAGDTTYRSTGSMMVCLLRDRPDQWQLLVEDRSLVTAAIEETLRLYAPVITASRMTTHEMEIDGIVIPEGSVIECATGLVGRDPERFENPHEFDITRPNPERHMGFSNGQHICLGQHLARLEMRRALEALLDNFPRMRLDPDYPPPVISGANMIGPREIYVRYD